MDKEVCLKAISYYDENIRLHSSPPVLSRYKKDGWDKILQRHIEFLKVERDFFIRELQAINAYDVKVSRKEGSH